MHKTSLVDVLKEFLVKSFYEKHDKETLKPTGLWIKVTHASDFKKCGRVLTQISLKQHQHNISMNQLLKMIYCPDAQLQLCVGNKAQLPLNYS